MRRFLSHNCMAEAQSENINLTSAGSEVRPPIVVVMGHVDHGKTTLLDAIRETEVAQKEVGGITQGIGAYEVVHAGKRVTFIDTPGHEAFFAMRAHGAKAADIALLVVAADDGVKPQTKEVIKHILESKIPFIVVINKIDKPGVILDKVKKDLSDNGVLIEEWGGQVPVALVSAKNKTGLGELLDLILLVAELEELKYSTEVPGQGYVIEARMDSRRGATASVIVTNGRIKAGDMVVSGLAMGKIKMMEDHTGKPTTEAIPSQPVLVVGLSQVPMPGEIFLVVVSEAEAAKIVEEHKTRHAEYLASLKIEPQGQAKFLPIIIKAAQQGCLEALTGALKQITSERVGLKLMKCEVGDINQSDIKQAETSSAKIFGFRVSSNKDTVNYADQRNVSVKTFEIIYEFVEGVKKAMSELLEPEITRNEVGKIDILAVFRTEKPRMIIGGKITSGRLRKGLRFEIQRKSAVVGLGKIVGLQKGKEAQDEVREGNEAGLQIESDTVIEIGDVLMGFEEEKKYPEL